MKALISGFALLALFAGTTLPIQSNAQTTTGGAPTMAPDTGTSPTSDTKKSKKSTKSHAKKRSKKSTTSQTSSLKQQHHSMNTKRSRHSTS